MPKRNTLLLEEVDETLGMEPEAGELGEPAPEQEHVPAVEPEAPQKQVSDHVPYDRFKEVVDKANRAEQEASQMRERWARVEERQRMVQEAVQSEAAQRAAERAHQDRPDATIDPQAAELWDLKQRYGNLENQVQQLYQVGSQRIQQVTQQQELQVLGSYIANDSAKVTNLRPDFADAANYAHETLVNQWKSLGRSDADARQIVALQVAGMAETARQNGVSFAEQAYNAAWQWGYRPANYQEQSQQNVTATQKLQQVRKGQGVRGLGGSMPSQDNSQVTNLRNLTIAQVEAMSDDEFAGLMANPRTRPILERALMGMELGG